MKIAVDGYQIGYDLAGSPSAPTVVLSHALGVSRAIWDHQMEPLLRDFRVLRYDTLGHGETDVPPGPYTLDRLAHQAAGLLGALGIGRVHFVGLSLGGMIGQLLAVTRPDLLSGLALCSTTSRVFPDALPLWQERIRVVESEGMEPLVEVTVGRWFTHAFRDAHPDIVDGVRGLIRATVPAGYAACCRCISSLNLTDRLPAVAAPTLIIVGENDQGTPVSASRAIHEAIRGSELVILPSAAHLANIEQADAFNRTLTSFLRKLPR